MPARPQSSHRPNSGPGLKVVLEVKQQTKPLIPTRLSEIEQTQIEVNVSDGLMQTKKAIFSTNHYLTFKVKVPQLKTDLRRQDEDFDQLQAYLVKAYPNVLVPPIKPCKAKKQLASKYINKREVMLSRFLRNVLRNRTLRGDHHLMSFLAETDDKNYKNTLAAMEKFKGVTKLADLVTFDGTVTITEQQVRDITKTLEPKVKLAATQTEKA